MRFCKDFAKEKTTTEFSAWGKNKINKKIPEIRFKKSVYNKTFGFPLSDMRWGNVLLNAIKRT